MLKHMTCKGICTRYKAQKPVGTGRYASGQKRCQICEIFIKWEGLWCPCCGYRLRTKPRNLKYKAKLRARVEADQLEAVAVKAAEVQEIELEPIVVKPAKKVKTAKAKTAKAKTAKVKTAKAKTAKVVVEKIELEPMLVKPTKNAKTAKVTKKVSLAPVAI